MPNRRVVEALMRHVWQAGGADPNEPGRLQALTAVLAPQRDPGSEEVKAELRALTDAAVARGLFGVPTFEALGRLYWGLDALPMLREDLLARCPKDLPKIFSYAEHAAQDSLLNTPNTWGWYLAGLVFKWLKAQGGVAAMEARNRAKADLLYGYIDGSDYYANPVQKAARSWMNVPFTLPRDALDAAFLKESEAAGLLALKGHRLLGGMRASLYNAMPIEGVQALVDFMRDFARRNG
jgi:hypothetical protein